MAHGIVIVGGGVGGLRCAERLRRKGYSGRIRIVNDEELLPYDRPHLSKSALTDIQAPQPEFLTSQEKLTESSIEVIAASVTEIHRERQCVILNDEETLYYDYLVIATGAEPIPLPIFADAHNVHMLRRWHDVMDLREALHRGGKVLVVGAGVLGLEIAASARTLDCKVDVVDLAPVPVSRLGGPDFSEALADLHQENGVSLNLGVSIADIDATDGKVTRAILSDGSSIEVDTVIVAIGARPDLRWLDGSGLVVNGELRCNTDYRTADLRIYAVGDVATVQQKDNTYVRQEHYTHAVDSAAVVATKILERELKVPQRIPYELPYFWTDQFGVKVQILGRLNPQEKLTTVIDDKQSQQRFQISSEAGRVTGVTSWNMPGPLNRCRKPLMRGVTTEELLEVAPWVKGVKA